MRAAAHASFRRLQDALSTGTGAPPLAVLLGDPEVVLPVRTAMGGSPGAEAGGEPIVMGQLLGAGSGGLALVEPPPCSLHVVEATELATYLKGLHRANGLIFALSADGAGNRPPPPAPLAGDGLEEVEAAGVSDIFPLVAEFYGGADMRNFVCVALVGAGSGDVAAKAEAARAACDALGELGDSSHLPEVFCVDSPEEVRRLVDHLRGSPPIACEPLQATSPIMTTYRVIRQKLRQRRPHSPRPATQASQCGPPSSPISCRPVEDEGERGGGRSPVPLSPTSMSSERTGRSVAAAAAPEEEEEISSRYTSWTVMVFGKTGAGKSHLANLILGHKAFLSADSVASVTNEHSVRKGVSADKTVTVLDTIGFGDTRLSNEVVIGSLRETALEAPGGIDLIIFVLKKERVTPVEQEILAYVTQLLFGPECLPNLYMVVTHAGRLASDVASRGPWLKEQTDSSTTFAAMVALLGFEPLEHMAFVENVDPNEAADDDERFVAERKQQRALKDCKRLMRKHTAPPYSHRLMREASDLQKAHLEDIRKEVRKRVEDEVRRELDKDRGVFEEERRKLRQEVEAEREDLVQKEEELERRCEEEWSRMRDEFEQRAKDLAREDLEPVAKEIVEKTEKKNKGRRCVVM
eukprot:TRINITY_DN20157_c0_g1_i1.p1 TRINITY_DN20157_c0_g1~~TRINITY_DN20157_c0_g1_i1.p1  ORF type:complete len:636 (-),score=164.09 TRINITY_DN20157_c0_g1_i1:115-2022(-)